MELSLKWDEARLQDVVENVRRARRRVARVGWVVLAIGIVAPCVLSYLLWWAPVANAFRVAETSSADRVVAGASIPPPQPVPPPRAPGTAWLLVYLYFGTELRRRGSARGAAWFALVTGGTFCVVLGLATLGIDAADRLFWHTGETATSSELIGYALLVLLGAVQLLCARALKSGSSIFACDYVRGEVTDRAVVLGLLQGEGPAFEKLREQVGLR